MWSVFFVACAAYLSFLAGCELLQKQIQPGQIEFLSYLRPLLILPVIGVLLTVGCIIFAAIAWKKRYWYHIERVY
jgi:hypothetical protein